MSTKKDYIMKVKCDQCYGAKKVSGIGFIYTDCPKCKGTGLIEAPKKPISPPPLEPTENGINEPLVCDEPKENIPLNTFNTGR
jgi:hypothetical protein